MPILKSAKKSLRVSQKNKAENDLTRAKVKSAVKGVKLAITKGEKTDEVLQAAYKELDIAAKKNVIHKNKAARLKSRLTKAVAKGTTEKPIRKKKTAASKAKAKAKKK